MLRIPILPILSLCAILASTTALSQSASPQHAERPAWVPPGTPGSGIDGTTFHAQVLLNAAGFSTGVIDGKDGMVVKAAIRGFQQSQGIEATGELDPGTRRALLQSNRSSTVTVRLSQADLSGDYVYPLPKKPEAQAKLPRLVQSVIRAWDVDVLTRSAQYNPPIDYSALDVFSDEEKAKQEGDPKSPLAKRGFVHVPSGSAPGGIVCRNGIEQDITINLIALRRLQAEKPEDTTKLRSYLLGLSLVAATAPLDGFLRQGCLLVPSTVAPWQVISRNGQRSTANALTHDLAKGYAAAKAAVFGVGDSKTGEKAVKFNKNLAKADAAVTKEKAAGGKGKKAKAGSTESTSDEATE